MIYYLGNSRNPEISQIRGFTLLIGYTPAYLTSTCLTCFHRELGSAPRLLVEFHRRLFIHVVRFARGRFSSSFVIKKKRAEARHAPGTFHAQESSSSLSTRYSERASLNDQHHTIFTEITIDLTCDWPTSELYCDLQREIRATNYRLCFYA